MKFERKIIEQVDVVTLRADMGVRYWEDGTINGEEDDNENPKMPLRDKDRWKIDIDLATGKIAGWPEGVIAETHYKVCDDGIYQLLDATGAIIAETDGYVPSMLSPKDAGHGDYVILEIGPDGAIAGWRADLAYFENY